MQILIIITSSEEIFLTVSREIYVDKNLNNT